MKKLVSVILFLTALATLAGAQPFADEIAAFKKQDAVSFPQKNAILFVGSSSFRKWTDVQQYFPSCPIINRGFGGSSLPDVIRYANDIIFPYQPKQIVIYCGENDIAAADSVSGKMVYDRFRQLFAMIREKMPVVPVVYVSIKPSPSRWHMRKRMEKANKMIKSYLRHQSHAKFISVWKAMLGEDGKPMPDIFEADNLHTNAKGYAIWQKLIEPLLIK